MNAFDATFSAPKSVSLLQALGIPAVASAVSICHTEALSVALGVLDRRAAFTRRQVDGVRKVTEAASSIYQEELRRRLSDTLGVAWGEDRNGCREMAGFTDDQLRTFSKRTSEIEAWLEANDSAATQTLAEKWAMDDTAALATRSLKDPTLTPEVQQARWRKEAQAVGLPAGEALVHRVCNQPRSPVAPSKEVVCAHLLDPEKGLCARDSRFGEARVTAAIAAAGGGSFELEHIEELTKDFLASEHVVRLVPSLALVEARPPQWSLTTHRRREDAVPDALDAMARRTECGHWSTKTRSAGSASPTTSARPWWRFAELVPRFPRCHPFDLVGEAARGTHRADRPRAAGPLDEGESLCGTTSRVVRSSRQHHRPEPWSGRKKRAGQESSQAHPDRSAGLRTLMRRDTA